MKNNNNWIKTNLLFIYITILVLVVASMSFLNLKLIPIDGLLQTYNSTRRIDIGEVPYRDFTPYLGLGPVYINFLGAKLFGSTLVAQFVFVNVLHLLIGVVILHSLIEVFISPENKKKFLLPSVVALTAIYLFGLQFPFKSVFFIFAEYTRPGNSALGLRSVILFLTILVCLKIEKGRFIFLGYLFIGISLIWSVDYALVTYLVGSIIFRFPKSPTFFRIITNTALNLIIGAAIGFILIFVFTQNSFGQWFTANYLIQRDFQFWYFGIDENFVYGITGTPYLIAFVFSIFIAATYLMLELNKLNVARFLTILAATLIGIVSQLNSAPSPRYLVFALLANMYGLLGLLILIKRDGLHMKFFNIKMIINVDTRVKVALDKLLYTRDLIVRKVRIVVVIVIVGVIGINLVIARNYINENIYVRELGGYVDPRLLDSVKNGKELAQSKETKILSTYSGVASIIAGKMNATKTDYIIHAFTAEERESWINSLKDPRTQTVITTREDVLKWEPWIAKANWWFYSELLERFEINKVGLYEVYWSRKTLDSKDSVNLADFKCLINVVDDSKAYISIVPLDLKMATVEKDQLFSIELDFESWVLDAKPLSRNRVTITPINELVNLDVSKPNTFLNVGAPNNSNSYPTYLKYSSLTSNQLFVKSSPELNSKLKLNECRVKAAYDFVSLFPKLPISNINFDGIVRDFTR